jgi:hypothetical protein
VTSPLAIGRSPEGQRRVLRQMRDGRWNAVLDGVQRTSARTMHPAASNQFRRQCPCEHEQPAIA